MLSQGELIRYSISATCLDILVNIEDQAENTTTSPCCRPWLTLCIEPISRMILASLLSIDPPGGGMVQTLLSQALAPTQEYPSGRRPDELWVDHAPVETLLQQQGLLQKLHIPMDITPPSGKGIPERAFRSLLLHLQKSFSASFVNNGSKKFFEKQLLISLPQLEEACKQWRETYSSSLVSEQQQSFLGYCQMRWQACPIDPHELVLLTDTSSHS